jgi:hypothetical protein
MTTPTPDDPDTHLDLDSLKSRAVARLARWLHTHDAGLILDFSVNAVLMDAMADELRRRAAGCRDAAIEMPEYARLNQR